MKATSSNAIHDFRSLGQAGFLVESKLGRVVLHTGCLLRCPHHWRWHWQGIVREFNHRPMAAGTR